MLPYSVNRAGVVWGPTDTRYEYEGYDNGSNQRLFNFAAGAAVLGGTTLHVANKYYRQPGDTLATATFKFVQDVERFAPFQMMATFRFSSMMSPFIQAERVVSPEHLEGKMVKISRDFLGKHTADYLSKITGRPIGEIATRLKDSNLYWQRTEGRYTGRLLQKTATGIENVLADNIGLLYSGGTGGLATRRHNRFAQAYINVIDDELGHAIAGVSEGEFGAVEDAVKHLYDPNRLKEVKGALPFIPVGPGSDKFSQKVRSLLAGTGIESKLTDGLTGLHLARAVPAFASSRLNELIKQLTESTPALQSVLTIKEGTFLMNQARYAKKAALAYGAWTLLENADWMKRKDNLVGEVGAAGAYGFGTGYIARKVFGASPKTAMMAGVATSLLSFTPPFEEGLVPGLATVTTRLNLFRAHLTHAPGIKYMPFVGSEYRDFLERSMPGSTSPTTALFGGIVLTAALNKRYFKKVEEWAVNMKEYGHSTNPFKPVDITSLRADAPKRWRTAALEAWDKTRDHSNYQVLPEHVRLQREINQKTAEELLNTTGFFSRFKAQAKAAFKGAGGEVNDYVGMLTKDKRPLGLISQGMLRWALPTMAVYGLLGGFATAETPEELQDLYEGKKYVPVRKGRWWEMGGTPYEGGAIKYWKPHWYRTLITRAKDKALWGADEDEYSPIYKAYAEEFTYELEQRNYFSRPYPVTDQALADVPFMGWLLAPIGRLLKPARMMHVEELYRQTESGETEFADFRSSIASNPVQSIGGMQAQSPVSPYAGLPLFGRSSREWMDQAGLVGYVSSQILEGLTGHDSIGARDRWLESASRMSSFNRDFWEAELGGAFMLSEPIRRFFPKDRNEIEQVNPIRNNMPSWIPAHLRFGDPMGRMDQGEVLFPGAGYAAIHPEVANLAPEDYPLTHQYNILANVAPWSASFRRIASALETMAGQGQLGENDLAFVNSINDRLRQSAERRNFMEDVNNGTQDIGAVSALIRKGYTGTLSGIKSLAAPIEYMVPFGFRPFSKLLPQGTAVEEYEQNMVYGTELSFWDKPWRDWFRPALYTAAHNWGGWNGIPGYKEESRDMNEYFDKLEYYKWHQLEQQAIARGDTANARQYGGMKQETMFGVNPYANLHSVMKAIPYEEKDYFYAFAREDDPTDRERILQMVPPYMRHIYMAQWEKLDVVDQQNDQILEQIIVKKRTMEAQRQAELGAFFQSNPLPRPNWIGFNPGVDLEDVKLKIVQQQGADIHDYGLWESQERLLARKPYINNEIVDQMYEPGHDEIRTKVYNVLKGYGISDSNIRVTRTLGSSPRNDVTIRYRDNRQKEIDRVMGPLD